MSDTLYLDASVFKTNVSRALSVKQEDLPRAVPMKWDMFHRCFNNAYYVNQHPYKTGKPVEVMIHFEQSREVLCMPRSELLEVDFGVGHVGTQLIVAITRMANKLDSDHDFIIPKLLKKSEDQEQLYTPELYGNSFEYIEFTDSSVVLHFLYRVPSGMTAVKHNAVSGKNEKLTKSSLRGSNVEHNAPSVYHEYKKETEASTVVLNLPLALYNALQSAAQDNGLPLLGYLQAYFTKQSNLQSVQQSHTDESDWL